MRTILHFILVPLIALTLIDGNAQDSHARRSIRHPSWPSFPNDEHSNAYFLGMFLQERYAKHFQTTAEPALFRVAILLARALNITINGKQVAYRVEETNGRDVIDVIDRTCRSISEDRILGIVGPEYSFEAKILAGFCDRTGLPLIGYSTTEPDLSDRNKYPPFYRLPPSEVMTARAMLKLCQKYGWNSTNVIYQGDSYGQSGLQALTEVFEDQVKISRSIRFDLFTNSPDTIRRQLEASPSRGLS